MEFKAFTKIYAFNAPVEKVFYVLTNQDMIERWTGSAAYFDPAPNGKFSLWDDTINGKNVYIDPLQIIQDWKEETWEKYSRVTINLIEMPDNTTELELIHENIPGESLYSVREGWEESFMIPLADLLDELMEEEGEG